MQYQVKETRVVNRFGKRYEADKNGVILADSPEIAEIFENMGMKKIDKDPVKEPVKVTPKKNAKI